MNGTQRRALHRVERFERGKIRPGRLRSAITRAASWASDKFGSPWAIGAAAAVVLIWLLGGPLFGFSDLWLLLINTVTTVITFLMVFVIQNTQARESKALHLKMDELLRAVPAAREEFMEAEEEDLDEILREKEIVDRADPAPPEHKKEERRSGGRRERKAG